MTFPPPLHGERQGGPRQAPPAPLVPLSLGEVIADKYTVTGVLNATPGRIVYQATNRAGLEMAVLEMSAPLHLDAAFDPDATVPLSRTETPMVLPIHEQATQGARSFVSFHVPPGVLISTGALYRWDPDRLGLVARIVRSFRRARDRRVYIPHCAWETLFVDHEQNVAWLSPAVASGKFVLEERGMGPSPSVRSATSETPSAESAEQTVQLDEFYMARLREILPALIMHNFSEPREGVEEPAGDTLAEEIPWTDDMIATPECRQLLSEIIAGRLVKLDDTLAAVDAFGGTRVVRLQNGWRTHRGRVRELNEDALALVEQSSVVRSRPMRFALYAVADGMGGHEAGEIASEITLKALSTEILGRLNLTSAREFGRNIHDHEYLQDVASRAIDRTNEILREYAQDAHANTRKKPGSTLVFALCSGPVATIGHVGDSRVYKIHADGTLERITRDHSPVQRMVDLCKITPEEAFYHPNRHQIYSNIGISPSQLTKGVESRYLREGEGLLLCSDGLSDMLRDSEIENLTRACLRDPRRLARLLVDAALEAGGMDNITVVALVRSPGPLKEERETPQNVRDEIEEADA